MLLLSREFEAPSQAYREAKDKLKQKQLEAEDMLWVQGKRSLGWCDFLEGLGVPAKRAKVC